MSDAVIFTRMDHHAEGGQAGDCDTSGHDLSPERKRSPMSAGGKATPLGARPMNPRSLDWQGGALIR